MDYNTLPFNFHIPDYLNLINDMYVNNEVRSTAEGAQIMRLLSMVQKGWSYRSQPLLFNTVVSILVTGCRISEVPSIQLFYVGDDVRVQLYATKQKKYRDIYIDRSSYSLLLNSFFDGGHRCLSEKEFNRRFKVVYPALVRIGREKNIKAGSHILRHLHVLTAYHILGVLKSDLMAMFGWSDEKILLDYLSLV